MQAQPDRQAAWVQVFRVLGRENINVKMMSQGASKTNISLIVDDAEGALAVQCLHDEFFGTSDGQTDGAARQTLRPQQELEPHGSPSGGSAVFKSMEL